MKIQLSTVAFDFTTRRLNYPEPVLLSRIYGNIISILLKLSVDVIGRKGCTISAIRTIVTSQPKIKVRIVIDENKNKTVGPLCPTVLFLLKMSKCVIYRMVCQTDA